MRLKIALLGLSADPAHTTHRAVSLELQKLGFDRVWWSITPQNPFKRGRVREAYAHRDRLARILLQGYEQWLEVRDFEAGLHVEREEVRSYAFLTWLNLTYPIYDFTFVMGADNWKHFHTWGHHTDILSEGLASVLVLPRGEEVSALLETPSALELADRQWEGRGVPPVGTWMVHPVQISLASSTAIVEDLKAGRVPEDLTEAQLAYIRTHGLYTK